MSDALRRSFAILKVVMVFLVGAFLISNLRIVGPEERGVILRLGKPVGEGEGVLLPPGAKLAWPYPIDEFVKVPMSRLQEIRSTVGWYQGGEDNFGASLNPVTEGYTLTGDTNIVHINASFTYRITDPARYLFGFENTPALLTNALNNAIHFASVGFKVDFLLKAGVAEFKERVFQRLNDLILQQQLGITVDALNATIVPPRQVKAAFEEVLAASTRRDAEKNAARSEADRILKAAVSTANSIVFSARGEKETETKRIRDEASQFESLQADFRRDPELRKRRSLSELVQRVSPYIDQKMIVNTDGQQKELRLLLNREEKLPPPPPAPTVTTDKH